jgi:hypothetical protein
MCVIDDTTQCGDREREFDPQGNRLFFRSGYPCAREKGHTGNHVSCDGVWLAEDSSRRDVGTDKPRLVLLRGGAP